MFHDQQNPPKTVFLPWPQWEAGDSPAQELQDAVKRNILYEGKEA